MQSTTESKTSEALKITPKITSKIQKQVRASSLERRISAWHVLVKPLRRRIASCFSIATLVLLPIAPARSESLHVIGELEGWAEVRQGEEDYRRAYVGDSLAIDDEIYVSPDAYLAILCDNGYFWEVPTGDWRVADGCPDTGTVRRDPDDPFGVRDPDDPKSPYPLYPRNTHILETRPLLRWNPVEGATRYRVAIDTNWERETTDIEIAYDGAKLEPESSHTFRVCALLDDDRVGEVSLGCSETKFSILAATEAEEVGTRTAELRQRLVEGDGRSLALADLYFSYDLKQVAIEFLTAAIDRGTENAAIYQRLGDFYWSVALYRPARENYERALALAGDRRRVRADARYGLGETWAAFGENLKAIAAFEVARLDYLLVGAEEKAEEVRERIEELGG